MNFVLFIILSSFVFNGSVFCIFINGQQSFFDGTPSLCAQNSDQYFRAQYPYFGYGSKFGTHFLNAFTSHITHNDISNAHAFAGMAIRSYEQSIRRDAEMGKRQVRIPVDVLHLKFKEFLAMHLMRNKCFHESKVAKIFSQIETQQLLANSSADNTCALRAQMQCNANAKFRSFDGSCNNLANPSWGQYSTCHQRVLPADYADAIQEPRVAHDGTPLPNARLLTLNLLPDIKLLDNKLTAMAMAFGQYIIHDISRNFPFGLEINCCPSRTALHPECLPIEPLLANDLLHSKYNQTCITFVRTNICNSCSAGPRQQLNQASAFIDFSHIFGVNANSTMFLRSFTGGKLLSGRDIYNEEILPPLTGNTFCNRNKTRVSYPCFLSGDDMRGSQHPALQALHAVMLRRHNQHAQAFAKVNPHWDDNRLFEEARRLLIAEFQKIIYDQYLPTILGKKWTNAYNLDVLSSGYTRYDPSVNPSTIQGWVVAAGRFAHSQVNSAFNVISPQRTFAFQLKDHFFDTSFVNLGHTSGIIKGLISQMTSSVDPFIVSDLKDFVNKRDGENFGRDLPAFNIMRGRDHGVPSYVHWLEYCLNYKVNGWSDLLRFIPAEQLSIIQQFYKHWIDVDLYIGGLSEKVTDGSVMGPTFSCINAMQYFRIKFGDRFYFEHGDQAGSFTPAQLENIRRTANLANMLCKTCRINSAQINPILHSSADNPELFCSSYPEFDYRLWTERFK